MRTTFIAVLSAASIAAVFFGADLMRGTPEEPVAAGPAPEMFPFIRSLEGTQPDGDLREDTEDRLVVSDALIRLFDYYLAAVGEKSAEEMRREIEHELDRSLKPRAAREAKELLARYLVYKQALVEVEKNPRIAGAGIDAIRARLAAMQQTRLQFFSAAEVDAMFGMEDAMHLDAIARLEVARDNTLGDAQKTERMAALDERLPAPLRDARNASLQIVRLEETAASLRSKGASEDDIYRMRAAALSPEAATRMAEVDREENEWKQRIAAYLAERRKLLEMTPAADRDVALRQLRQARFSEEEQLRLPAYE